jgi:NAD(P)-dependent dehydrogenase (short-subunit alcohol dehydrogenase family)
MQAVVVFGASGGIGSALSRRLADKGMKLMVAGRSEDQTKSLAGELGAAAYVLDATVPEQVEACVQAAHDQFKRVTGLVNCVGSMLLKPAHLTTDSEWRSTIATNLTSAFAIIRAGARVMMKGGGSIVLMSSAAARTGLANHEAIAAAKGGIIGLTLSAAASYASRGLRVNCVAPGLVRTPLTAKITGSEKALAASTALHALGRIGEPEDIASVIDWLLDPEQSWVTGQIFGVDGGLGTIRTRG